MDYMFKGCISLKYISLSNFDTSKVTTMREMFYYSTSITSIDLSNVYTQNVTNFDYMFYNCPNLNYLDISHFNSSGNISKLLDKNNLPSKGTIISNKDFINKINNYIPSDWSKKVID